jgi:hypothetical protein
LVNCAQMPGTILVILVRLVAFWWHSEIEVSFI